MTDRQPVIRFNGDNAYSFTSPRDISEHENGLRPHAVAMDVFVPIGQSDKRKTITVPLDREALLRLMVAASGALAVLDGVRTR